METACRAALRGHGTAEPNPLVGCVVLDAAGRVASIGHHRRPGGPHAEVIALGEAGGRTDGGTAVVTLEPCRHQGRTGPCTEALLEAGIRRVVIGERDPHPEAGGGAEELAAAGLEVFGLSLPATARLAAPFLRRVHEGRPWVVLKWAQSLDGRIAARTGASTWISDGASRRAVHRERARVDVVLTGLGTVLADDPRLTPRDHGPRPPRRMPRRVVVDPELATPPTARLFEDIEHAPVELLCTAEAADGPNAEPLRRAGAAVVPLPMGPDGLDLGVALRRLAADHDATHVLVEAGPGLASSLLREGLVDETWVFVAPDLLFADDEAIPPVCGRAPAHPREARRLATWRRSRAGEDLVVRARIVTDDGRAG